MEIKDAKLIFYTLCNELWKLKLIGTVSVEKGKHTESVQFNYPKSFIDSNQFAAVQYNDVKATDIGVVILRFYIEALETAKIFNLVYDKYENRRLSENPFAKYVGYSNNDYFQFEFTVLDSEQKVLKDIKSFFRIIANRLEKREIFLLLNLDPNIKKLPTAIS